MSNFFEEDGIVIPFESIIAIDRIAVTKLKPFKGNHRLLPREISTGEYNTVVMLKNKEKLIYRDGSIDVKRLIEKYESWLDKKTDEEDDEE